MRLEYLTLRRSIRKKPVSVNAWKGQTMDDAERSSEAMPTTTETEWLSVEAFCKRFKLGKNLVYDAVRENRLPSAKVGAKILIPADALNRLVEKRSAELR